MDSPSGFVAQLDAQLERLLAVDAAVLSDEELQRLVVGLGVVRARLEVAAAAVVHRWEERGSWRADQTLQAGVALGRDTRSCHRRARFELRRARLLERMPHTRAAVLAGRLSMDHVDLFVRHATTARFELFVEHEQMLVEQCASFTLFDDARRALQYWAQAADDELGLRHERPAPSTLYASRSSDTGQAHLDGCLSPVDAEIVLPELARLERQLHREDRANSVVRTRAQRRAAALVLMATRSLNATGVTARPLFQVIIGDDTARRLCELASGHVVQPEDLAGHIDTAVIESFLFDGPTVVIAKTRQRTFTGALRRAIQVRDRRCQHPSGCPTPAIDADIDHRRPAARGGPTSQFNGRVGCIPHNRHPHLRDHTDELPERHITTLDTIRCRLRWQLLHDNA